MSWLRFGITAVGAGTSLLALPSMRVPSGQWELLVIVAFLYSVPNIFLRPGRPTRWTRARILANTVLDFALVTAAVAISGGASSDLIWLFGLVIVGNILRYGEGAGALTAGGSMLSLAGIVLWKDMDPNAAVPTLMQPLGFFWILYLLVAYLSRYAVRMERVARKGTQLMEAIGRIGVPVNLAGNVALALQAVCEEITVLFDVDHVFIWLVQGDEIVGAAATGPAKEEFLALRRPADDEYLLGARIVRERRPLYVNNLQSYANGLDSHIARAHGIQAVAGIPLIHGDASVGAMLLGDSRHANRFRQEDLAPAMLLGNLAATALYHASMHDQLRRAYNRTLETLGEAIDVRDTYTGGHSLRIARYADLIARQVGCPPHTIDHIRTAAVLHDVGKIGIPDSILLKPGRLNEREMEIMRSHSLIGARLLRTAGFSEDAVTIVRHLHERYDGWGYPEGLRGEAIPLGSRILAVADAYEAMTSDRVYRSALNTDDAVTELVRCSNVQFDPKIVEAFIAVHDSGALHPPEHEEPGPVPEQAAVFATLSRLMLERFGHFAGDGLANAVVNRLRAQAQARGWILRVHNGALDVETVDRHAAADARRHMLTWLVTGLEQAGGERLALHLLTEAVASLPPAARDVYRNLLDPTAREEAMSGSLH